MLMLASYPTVRTLPRTATITVEVPVRSNFCSWMDGIYLMNEEDLDLFRDDVMMTSQYV